MLSHRPYLRGDYQREKTSGLTWLLSAVIAGFVIQVVMGANWFSGAGGHFTNLFALTIPAIQNGWIWTLFTHSFLHSPDFVIHVVLNCVVLYFLGRELLPILGMRRLLGLYGFATIVGGLAWTAVHWRFGAGQHLGATAAIDALLIVFACFYPSQPMTFLLFFIVPVTLRPKHLAGALVVIESILMLAYEVPGKPLPFDLTLSSSAHLGGLLTGWVYFRYVHDASWFNPEDRSGVELPRWLTRAKTAPVKLPALPSPATPPTRPGSPVELKAELDRILDKINSHGFASLSVEEKRILGDARDLLSRK